LIESARALEAHFIDVAALDPDSEDSDSEGRVQEVEALLSLLFHLMWAAGLRQFVPQAFGHLPPWIYIREVCIHR